MNNERRSRLRICISKFKESLDALNSIIEDEESVFDNIPENLQYSMRAEEMQDNIDVMNEASSIIEDAISELEDIAM